MANEGKKKEQRQEIPGGIVAKKDFTIIQGEFKWVIKTGDSVSDVPEKYHANLKTEGVI